jgi:hypothetical protein
MTDLQIRKAFARVMSVAAATRLPAIEEGTSYGTPALKIRGKLIARIKDRDTLVMRCALDEKELLIEAFPDVYFETDHYRGWPWVLIRLGRIGKQELAVQLERAWRMQAPRTLIAAFDRPTDPAASEPRRPARRRRTSRAAAARGCGTSRR